MQNPAFANYTSADVLAAISRAPDCEDEVAITKLRNLTVTEYLGIALPFLAALALGIVCDIASRRFDYLLLRMFGDAFIVAGVLGIGLEISATRILIEKVSDQIAEKLTGRGLPEKTRGLISEMVETSIIREDFRKSYRFSEVDEHGLVTIEITIRYVARNYSATNRKFVPSIQEEVFYSPEFKTFEYGAREDARALRPEEIAKLTKIDPKTRVKSLFAPGVSLESWHVDKQAQCPVLIRYSVRMRDQYLDVTNFGGATEGAIIELEYIPTSLEFVSGMDDTIAHAEGSSVWEFKRPFINGQHLHVWWFKKITPSSAQT